MNVNLKATNGKGYVTAIYPPQIPLPDSGEVVMLYDGGTKCQGMVTEKHAIEGTSSTVVSFSPFWGTSA